MKYLIVGMGKSGVAACELLHANGEDCAATDADAAAAPQLPVPFVAWTRELVKQAQTVVLSPGVPADLPELAGCHVIGDLELASRYLRGPVIGITGSNGKTTTTAMIGHVLQRAGVACQVGGNIGTAPAAMVDASREGQWNVLELSSFQLETTETFRPEIGSALNVTPNHLDRHYTLQRYAEVKGRMFTRQRAGDHKVLNAANTFCREYAAVGHAEAHWFNEGTAPIDASDVSLPGTHNFENAWAAAVICELAGASRDAIRSALGTFPGVEHRLEFVRERNGVHWYNDSKATSVDATLKAIAALDGPLWIILGGKDKGSDYRPLIVPLRDRTRGVLLIGKAADLIAGHLGDALPLIHAQDMATAVAHAARHALAGDTVLLAPACASFDQFRSFEHRGEVFKSLVWNLKEER